MSTKSPTTYPTSSEEQAERDKRDLRDQTQRGRDKQGNPTSVYVPGGARSTSPRVPTPLAPFPGTRTADGDDDPFSIPPREGEEVPPVMITQDVSSPGRTVSTNYIPGDEFDPNNPGVPTPGNPGGGTGGGEPAEPVVTAVAIDSATILALSTTPKTLVPAPAAGASLEFQGATGTFTPGTVAYIGAGVLQIKCGSTVVSNDVPVTALSGASSGDIIFTALPGATPTADQPITLTQSGGTLTDGDGTLSLDVTTVEHPPNTGALNFSAQADYDRNSREERDRRDRGVVGTHAGQVGRIGRMVERGERHESHAKSHEELHSKKR